MHASANEQTETELEITTALSSAGTTLPKREKLSQASEHEQSDLDTLQLDESAVVDDD